MPQLSITTDYCVSQGNPSLPLQLIADAGFTHLHWSHHFCDDFLYGPAEISSIRSILKKTGLAILDVHGSFGIEKRWWSLDESERRAGVELVLNRAAFFHELEGEGHLIMHIPCVRKVNTEEQNEEQRKFFAQCLRSLDELLPELEKMNVKLALENMPDDTWEMLEKAMDRYPEKQVGICYDSGHGNINQSALPHLERNKRRFIAMHSNDNNGLLDQHQPPYLGTVDWERYASIIASSSYSGPLSFEITMRATPFRAQQEGVSFQDLSRQPVKNQKAFLADAHERCLKLHNRLCQLRQNAAN